MLEDDGLDLVLCWVVLLYDIGKFVICCYEFDGGVSFYYYEVVGVKMVCKWMWVLKYFK